MSHIWVQIDFPRLHDNWHWVFTFSKGVGVWHRLPKVGSGELKLNGTKSMWEGVLRTAGLSLTSTWCLKFSSYSWMVFFLNLWSCWHWKEQILYCEWNDKKSELPMDCVMGTLTSGLYLSYWYPGACPTTFLSLCFILTKWGFQYW